MTRLGRRLSLGARYLPSLLTFIVGTGALLAVDALIARFAAQQDVEQWVALKTLAMIGGASATAGLDAVIVREPSQSKRLVRWSVLTILAVSLGVGIAAGATGYYEDPVSAFLAVLGIGLSTLAFGVLRSRLRLNQAQAARDLWKLLLLILLWPLFFRLDMALGWVLVLALAIGTGLSLIPGAGAADDPRLRVLHNEVRDYRSAMSVAWPFLLAATALSVASYGELLLVRTFGSTAEVHILFRAVILFSYPSLVLNAYFAAMLGLGIRQAPERASILLRSSRLHLIGAGLLLPVAAAGLGYVAEPFLFPGSHTPLLLAVLLSATAGMRFVSTAASAFIGALATAGQLRSVTWAYFLAAIATLPMCAAMVWSGLTVPVAAALTALLHWLFRTSLGWRLTALISAHYSKPRQP